MDDGVLDAKARRELAALRRRAYGPDADILTDPAAVARLESLERRAHPTEPATDDAETDAATQPPADDRRVVVIGAARPAWHVALIAGCGIVALALGTLAAIVSARQSWTPVATPSASAREPPLDVRVFAQAASTRVVARLPLEGTLRGVIPSSDPGALPLFPTEEPLLWVDPLGQYFGIHVWIARTVSGGSCVLAELPARDRGECVDAGRFGASALLVTVPFPELAEGTRPTEMQEDESFGIWWRPDRPIELLIGPTPKG